MKKSDLKNGMIVELRNGNRYILIDDTLYGIDEWDSLNAYFEDLTINSAHEELKVLDIVKVFENTRNGLVHILKTKNLTLLWERKEIDWSKVPFGTKVRVWDFENDIRLIGKYLGYNKEHTHPYSVFVDTTEPKIWRNCELIEEPVTYEEIRESNRKYCDRYNAEDDCLNCKYCSNDCTISYILDNYNITRK